MSVSELTQKLNTLRGDCFGYKIAVQIECLQIFHLPQNNGTLQLSLHISK